MSNKQNEIIEMEPLEVSIQASVTVSMNVTNKTDEITIQWNPESKSLKVTEWAYNKRNDDYAPTGIQRKTYTIEEIADEFYDYEQIENGELNGKLLTKEELLIQYTKADSEEKIHYKKIHYVTKR